MWRTSNFGRLATPGGHANAHQVGAAVWTWRAEQMELLDDGVRTIESALPALERLQGGVPGNV